MIIRNNYLPRHGYLRLRIKGFHRRVLIALIIEQFLLRELVMRPYENVHRTTGDPFLSRDIETICIDCE